MIEKVVLGTMTMNAGKGIPGSTIRWALNTQFKLFAKVVVIDGDMTEEAKAFYAQFSNVVAIDSPWKDSYVAQYRRFADELEENQLGLWLDDDEICSPELLEKLHGWEEYMIFSVRNLDIFEIPCVLHLTEDGKSFYPAEPPPIPRGRGDKPPGLWTKSIIFRKNEHLDFRWFGSHVIPITKRGPKWQTYLGPFPYYHMKSLESFVYNDVWQAFLSPEGQQYTPQEAAKFRMLTQCYKSTKEFKEATRKGTWPPPLKKFAWDMRREYNSPISRLAWVYFILEGNTMPERDEFMEWENVKQYVLSPDSMKIYSDAKKKNLGIVVDENT